MGAAGEARGASSARDAWLALRLFALAPLALGGVSLRAGAGPVRDRWLADLRAALAPGTPWRPCPLHIDLDRLLGGIDLAATLQAGRSVAQRGLLAEADGGVVVLAMAERTGESAVAHITAALDRREVAIARDGIDARSPARFGLVALDEGDEADEGPREAMLDRLAFHVDLHAISTRDLAAIDLFDAPAAAPPRPATVRRRAARGDLRGGARSWRDVDSRQRVRGSRRRLARGTRRPHRSDGRRCFGGGAAGARAPRDTRARRAGRCRSRTSDTARLRPGAGSRRCATA